MDKKKRQEIETLVISSMDVLDKSKTNSDYYKDLFARMSDTQFEKFIAKRFPFKFHYRPSVVEPSMDEVTKALHFIGVPLMEKVYEPSVYVNKDGVPVNTKEALVVYIHHKPVQQFITKKNKWSMDTSNRDMKTGRLVGADKGAVTSDREFESMAVQGMDSTMKEFYTIKADSMNAKNLANNIIGSTGMLRLEDVPVDRDDSLSKNLMNVYMIGAHINSNLLNEGNYTPYTLRQREYN
jgi:hypothetical protein